ncbi:MAG: SH3 domain-containing protein, partial [Microcystaceae cyanobacterium]
EERRNNYGACISIEKINEAKKTDAVIIGDSNLPKNVRSGPGLEYDIIGTLKTGDRVKIINRDIDLVNRYDWYKIKSPRIAQEGWINSYLIKRDYNDY